MLTIVCVENKKLNEKISHTPFIFFIRKTPFYQTKINIFVFRNLIKKKCFLFMTSMASGIYCLWRRRRKSGEVDCGRKNKTSVKRECYTGSHS